MAFFPRAFYDDSSSFTPLFRLLDDFDNYSRQGGQQQGKRAGGTFWQPKFDVRETGDNYELHGELPGMNKDNVHIEFTEPQSLVVRGKVERSYSSGTPPSGLLESSNKGAITESGEHNSHKASVEDATDDNANRAAQTDAHKQVQKSNNYNNGNGKATDQNAKFWLSERSVGEFSRTFNFPSPVNQEAVSAGFKDGILNIVVPKAKKHGTRRIAIQ